MKGGSGRRPWAGEEGEGSAAGRHMLMDSRPRHVGGSGPWCRSAKAFISYPLGPKHPWSVPSLSTILPSLGLLPVGLLQEVLPDLSRALSLSPWPLSSKLPSPVSVEHRARMIPSLCLRQSS